MRRMGDLLAANHPERTFVLPMPRSSGPEVQKRLAADLHRLDEWLTPGGGADRQEATEGPARGAATLAEPPTVDYPEPSRPGGVFLVAGPLSDDSLLRLIGRLGSHVSGLESCTSPDRWKPLAPTSRAIVDYAALAAQALETGMCPRRSTAERRDYLVRRLDETRPSSIIYARQSFCDPGAYDALLVAALAEERRLPYLEIEVDFPFDANGPLHTRVEAFLESQLLDDDLLGGC
jgi:2-hydroxyglutaryl-CoA dehydratase, D-component